MSEFIGIAYDEINEVVFDRSPVIRSTKAEAEDDARQLVKMLELDASYAYVQFNGELGTAYWPCK